MMQNLKLLVLPAKFGIYIANKEFNYLRSETDKILLSRNKFYHTAKETRQKQV